MLPTKISVNMKVMTYKFRLPTCLPNNCIMEEGQKGPAVNSKPNLDMITCVVKHLSNGHTRSKPSVLCKEVDLPSKVMYFASTITFFVATTITFMPHYEACHH